MGVRERQQAVRAMRGQMRSPGRPTARREDQGISHLRTRPYRPQTNGKIERFHQTMGREWAYGMTYASSRARARALPYWMSHYNERRPHSALAGKAPITRVRSEPL